MKKEICEECGKETMKKMVSAAAFRLKGGGWYSDGYGDGKSSPVDGSSKSETVKKDKSDKVKKEDKSTKSKKAASA